MELRHLRYFVAVAEELNFRKAAERLHLTQPSLSAQIRQLEEEMGLRLLERDTHSVTLNPAGVRFLEDCRRILRDVKESTRSAQRIGRGEAGQLSIGFVASLGHGFLPQVLKTYREKFPDVELHLTELDTTQQIKAINSRRIDLGIIGLGLTEETTDLQLRVVSEERLMAVLPQGHPLAKGHKTKPRPLPLSTLANEPFLLAARQSAPLYNPWLLVLCHQAGFQPHLVQEVGQPTTVLNYVAANLGVTILPEQFSRQQTEGVVFLPLASPVPRYRYCAAWLPENQHPALLHFVNTAESVSRIRKT